MRVAEAVGQAVADLGAGHAFGVVGSGNFAVTNALLAGGVPFVAARHEGGAATMADAYARTSGRCGVLTLHQGCGLTNAITGITEAAKSRTPLLVLAADVAGSAVNSNFRIDQDALVRSVGAVPERIHSPASALTDVQRAYRTAVQRRRTVVLNLPLDVQAAELPGSYRLDPVPASPRAAPAPTAVGELAGLLEKADRPVFLAGRGALAYGPELAALAARTGALLATSAVAAGTFVGEAYDLGICGGFATPLAAELIAGADLLVAWGCSLTMWTTRHGRLVGADTVVAQVDDDLSALGAREPIHLGVLGDVGLTIEAVARSFEGGAPARDTEPRGSRSGSNSKAAGSGCRTRICRRRAPSTRARSRSGWTSCCPPPASWRSTQATSWATRRRTCPCRHRGRSVSRNPSSRLASVWPP